MFKRFDAIGAYHILVIGDVMLDKYIYGETSRISPEAPVPVVLTKGVKHILGGAANVAANLTSLGANATVIGCVGNDQNGDILKQLLDASSIDAGYLYTANARPTTTKMRIVAKGQQMLRVDEENSDDLTKLEEAMLIDQIDKALSERDYNGIILQDYNKGVMTPTVISQICSMAKDRSLPLFVDPKHKNFWMYKGVALFKPNLNEIKNAVSEFGKDSLEEMLVNSAAKLNCGLLMCTMADKGIACVKNGKVNIYPTSRVAVIDVSGAGDSALSIMALSYLLGYDVDEIALLSNLGGKIACMKSGVSVITQKELRDAYIHHSFR